MLTTKQVVSKRKILERRLRKLTIDFADLQENCSHEFASREQKPNDNNNMYDTQHWVTVSCPACKKNWNDYGN